MNLETLPLNQCWAPCCMLCCMSSRVRLRRSAVLCHRSWLKISTAFRSGSVQSNPVPFLAFSLSAGTLQHKTTTSLLCTCTCTCPAVSHNSLTSREGHEWGGGLAVWPRGAQMTRSGSTTRFISFFVDIFLCCIFSLSSVSSSNCFDMLKRAYPLMPIRHNTIRHAVLYFIKWFTAMEILTPIRSTGSNFITFSGKALSVYFVIILLCRTRWPSVLGIRHATNMSQVSERKGIPPNILSVPLKSRVVILNFLGTERNPLEEGDISLTSTVFSEKWRWPFWRKQAVKRKITRIKKNQQRTKNSYFTDRE